MIRSLLALVLLAGCVTAPAPDGLWPTYGWRGSHQLPDGTTIVAVDLAFDGHGGMTRTDTWQAGTMVVAFTTHGAYVADAFCCVTLDFRGAGMRPAHISGHTVLTRKGHDLLLSERYDDVWRFRPSK